MWNRGISQSRLISEIIYNEFEVADFKDENYLQIKDNILYEIEHDLDDAKSKRIIFYCYIIDLYL